MSFSTNSLGPGWRSTVLKRPVENGGSGRHSWRSRDVVRASLASFPGGPAYAVSRKGLDASSPAGCDSYDNLRRCEPFLPVAGFVARSAAGVEMRRYRLWQ